MKRIAVMGVCTASHEFSETETEQTKTEEPMTPGSDQMKAMTTAGTQGRLYGDNGMGDVESDVAIVWLSS